LDLSHWIHHIGFYNVNRIPIFRYDNHATEGLHRLRCGNGLGHQHSPSALCKACCSPRTCECMRQHLVSLGTVSLTEKQRTSLPHRHRHQHRPGTHVNRCCSSVSVRRRPTLPENGAERSSEAALLSSLMLLKQNFLPLLACPLKKDFGTFSKVFRLANATSSGHLTLTRLTIGIGGMPCSNIASHFILSTRSRSEPRTAALRALEQIRRNLHGTYSNPINLTRVRAPKVCVSLWF